MPRNWGCIPTKALIAAADTFAQIQHAEAFGITVEGGGGLCRVDRAQNKVVTQLKSGIKQLLAANGVKQFAGVASFKDRNTIAIGESTVIGARKVIIATGSTSAMQNVLPKHERIVESRGFLDIERLPESIIILGGGIIGCELACMAAMLGVKVTIVELLEDILPILNSDLRHEIRAHMKKKLSIRVLTGKALETISANSKGVRGSFGDEAIDAELLLCAVGRKPVTEGLALEKAGLATNQRGFIDSTAAGPDSCGPPLPVERGTLPP